MVFVLIYNAYTQLTYIYISSSSSSHVDSMYFPDSLSLSLSLSSITVIETGLLVCILCPYKVDANLCWLANTGTSKNPLKKFVLASPAVSHISCSSLLITQQYKIRIKGKVEQSRERSSALPYISV